MQDLLSNFTLTELFMAREWLWIKGNDAKINTKYAHQALKKIQEVDKEIWFRTISSDTPWGEVKPLMFKDDDFDQTLKELRKENEDENANEAK